MSTIAERIKDLRKRANLTQREFAERIGAKQNTVAQYEIGRNVPIDPVINSICREFGVDEVWLRTGDGEPFRQESREEEIARFAASTLSGSDEFKKSFVSMLAKLDADDWKALEKLFADFADKMKK